MMPRRTAMTVAAAALAAVVAAPRASGAQGTRGAPGSAQPAPADAQPGTMARIPAGDYLPLYGTTAARRHVNAFRLDVSPVTRGEFLAFVRANPSWRRDSVRTVYAAPGYLVSWPGALDVGSAAERLQPVTEVSWFAARAYCAAQGKRLPTTDEWEYAAAASETARDATHDPAFLDRLVVLYAANAYERLRPGRGFRNVYGVRAMHGGPWEWTEDFNGIFVSADSREAGATSRQTDFHSVCASAAIGATDPTNYPAFLRAAVRAALDARSTVTALGFRCAAGP
jgi:formylglycine-generating enzyme required for sulfatase activity